MKSSLRQSALEYLTGKPNASLPDHEHVELGGIPRELDAVRALPPGVMCTNMGLSYESNPDDDRDAQCLIFTRGGESVIAMVDYSPHADDTGYLSSLSAPMSSAELIADIDRRLSKERTRVDEHFVRANERLQSLRQLVEISPAPSLAVAAESSTEPGEASTPTQAPGL